MAKYLVETYYTCTFKVNHYLDDINEAELKNLEKRDDGKFEVLDVKLDNRKTKSLDPKNNKVLENNKVEVVTETDKKNPINKENVIKSISIANDKSGKRFINLLPDLSLAMLILLITFSLFIGFFLSVSVTTSTLLFSRTLLFLGSRLFVFLLSSFTSKTSNLPSSLFSKFFNSASLISSK